MTEADVRRRVVEALRARGAVVWSQTGAIGGTGRPDLAVCYRGRFIAVELKAPAGRLSRLQRVLLEQVESAGGIAAVVRSPAEAMALLDRVDTEQGGQPYSGASL